MSQAEWAARVGPGGQVSGKPVAGTIKVYGAPVPFHGAHLPQPVRRFMDKFKPGPATPENLKNPGWRERVGFDNIMTEEDLEQERAISLPVTYRERPNGDPEF